MTPRRETVVHDGPPRPRHHPAHAPGDADPAVRQELGSPRTRPRPTSPGSNSSTAPAVSSSCTCATALAAAAVELAAMMPLT